MSDALAEEALAAMQREDIETALTVFNPNNTLTAYTQNNNNIGFDVLFRMYLMDLMNKASLHGDDFFSAYNNLTGRSYLQDQSKTFQAIQNYNTQDPSEVAEVHAICQQLNGTIKAALDALKTSDDLTTLPSACHLGENKTCDANLITELTKEIDGKEQREASMLCELRAIREALEAAKDARNICAVKLSEKETECALVEPEPPAPPPAPPAPEDCIDCSQPTTCSMQPPPPQTCSNPPPPQTCGCSSQPTAPASACELEQYLEPEDENILCGSDPCTPFNDSPYNGDFFSAPASTEACFFRSEPPDPFYTNKQTTDPYNEYFSKQPSWTGNNKITQKNNNEKNKKKPPTRKTKKIKTEPKKKNAKSTPPLDYYYERPYISAYADDSYDYLY